MAGPLAAKPHVVMPDHVHLVMTLPDDDDDFSTRLMLIKAGSRAAFSPPAAKPAIAAASDASAPSGKGASGSI